jgi:hypothetical protein
MSQISHSGPPHNRDRAAILTRQILLIVAEALRSKLYDGDIGSPRAEIEAMVRDEIADAVQQALYEIRIRPTDE